MEQLELESPQFNTARNGPLAGCAARAAARVGLKLLDKDYGSRRGQTGSDGSSA